MNNNVTILSAHSLPSLPTEHWFAVLDSSTHEVSTFGRFRNKHTGKILKLQNYGVYLGAQVEVNGKPTSKKIHVQLISGWLGCPIPKGYEVDHIDDNKENNAIWNLQLLTKEEHDEKSYGRRRVASGNRMSEEEISKAVELKQLGHTLNAIGKLLGREPNLVSRRLRQRGFFSKAGRPRKDSRRSDSTDLAA